MDTPKDDRPAWEVKEWEDDTGLAPLDEDEQRAAFQLWRTVRWLANYNQYGAPFDPAPYLAREPDTSGFAAFEGMGPFVKEELPPCTWEHSIAGLDIEHHKEFWVVRLRSIEASSSWDGEGRGRTLLAALKDLEEHAG